MITLDPSINDPMLNFNYVLAAMNQLFCFLAGELIITIVDVNRHAPVFTQSEYMEHMVEEQPVGTVLSTYTAVDKETPISAITIEPPSPYFNVDNVTGKCCFLLLHLWNWGWFVSCDVFIVKNLKQIKYIINLINPWSCANRSNFI